MRKAIFAIAAVAWVASFALNAFLDNSFFDNSPRVPEPSTMRTAPYVVKRVVVYIRRPVGIAILAKMDSSAVGRSHRDQSALESEMAIVGRAAILTGNYGDSAGLHWTAP